MFRHAALPVHPSIVIMDPSTPDKRLVQRIQTMHDVWLLQVRGASGCLYASMSPSRQALLPSTPSPHPHHARVCKMEWRVRALKQRTPSPLACSSSQCAGLALRRRRPVAGRGARRLLCSHFQAEDRERVGRVLGGCGHAVHLQVRCTVTHATLNVVNQLFNFFSRRAPVKAPRSFSLPA